MTDETLVETTTPSPSEEIQTAEPVAEAVSEDVKTPETEQGDKSVPYDRFKEVIDERNKYKELLNTYTPKEAEDVVARAKTISEETGESYADAIKIVQDMVKKETDAKFDQINRKIELDNAVRKYPDFYKYSEQIKEKILENKTLSWDDAYKLAKFDDSQVVARKAGEQAAYNNIAKKQSANVESAQKAKSITSGKTEEIDVFAKDANGKFIYSLSEIADILPKK